MLRAAYFQETNHTQRLRWDTLREKLYFSKQKGFEVTRDAFKNVKVEKGAVGKIWERWIIKADLEVCGSRIPSRMKEDMDSRTERVLHLNTMIKALGGEISDARALLTRIQSRLTSLPGYEERRVTCKFARGTATMPAIFGWSKGWQLCFGANKVWRSWQRQL